MTWLAIVAVQPAENELPKIRQVMNKIHRNVGFRNLANHEVKTRRVPFAGVEWVHLGVPADVGTVREDEDCVTLELLNGECITLRPVSGSAAGAAPGICSAPVSGRVERFGWRATE